MPTEERAIGRLEAEVSNIKAEISEIKQDVKTLLTWRWKLWGVTAAIAAISAGIVQVVSLVLGHV